MVRGIFCGQVQISHYVSSRLLLYSFLTLKEELIGLRKYSKIENLKITLYGTLKKQEIDEIQQLGFKFKNPLEFNAFLFEIQNL